MTVFILFVCTVCILAGYAVARIQLRGRFILASEAIEDAEREVTAYRWKSRQLPPHTTTTVTLEEDDSPLTLRESDLIRTSRCPSGYGAAQILGYNDFGTIHESFYPGGKAAFFESN